MNKDMAVSTTPAKHNPLTQLAELMRGLGLPHATATVSPEELFAIGRAIATQAAERVAVPGAPTQEQIELFARDLCSAGRLGWAGFRKDEAGKYTIPWLSQSVYELIVEVLQKFGAATPPQQATNPITCPSTSK